MPNVDNVSEIVNILSGTIQRNVLVRGTVEILANRDLQMLFFLHMQETDLDVLYLAVISYGRDISKWTSNQFGASINIAGHKQ